MKTCPICKLELPERYVDRARNERDLLICPVCYTIVADYREKADDQPTGD